MPALKATQVLPVLAAALPDADEPVLDYLTGMICDEFNIPSSSHLVALLGDLLVSYDLASDDSGAKLVCDRVWQSLAAKGLVKGAAAPALALLSDPKKAATASMLPSTSTSGASGGQSRLSSDGDEWDMSDVAVVYKDQWKPAFEPARPRLVPTLSIQARYIDGMWYSAVIDTVLSDGHFVVRFPEYDNETVVAGIERIKIKERIAIAQSTLQLAAERSNDSVADDVDPFEAAYQMKKFEGGARGIQRFGERVKKAKSVIIEEKKELTKRQLKKELKEKRLAEQTAKRERLRIEKAAKLQQRALEKYLASDKSHKVTDIEIDHFSMSTPDGSQELVTNSKLKLVQGRRYALIGRNGMGKTTLLRLIANYELFGFPENIRVVHVEQEVAGNNVSVIDTVIAADIERDMLMKEEKELIAMLGDEEKHTAKLQAEKSAAERKSREQDERAAKSAARADEKDESHEEEEVSVDSLMEEMKDLDDNDTNTDDGDDNDSEDDDGAEDDDKDDIDEENDGEGEEDDTPAATKSAPKVRARGGKSAKHSASAATIAAKPKAAVPPHIRYQEVVARLLEIDAYGAEARARAILNGLQFSTARQSQLTKDLSGGWRMRVAIACALFVAPDLLLLDEPTNHLDWPAVLWLEDYLQRYEKTLIVVSHDRSFLDSVATDVIHLYQRNLHYYKGNYSSFEKIRRTKLIQLKREFEANKLKREHIQQFIDRFRYNANRAALVQSRIKTLQKMDALIEVVEDAAVHFSFPQPDPITGALIGMNDVSFGYVKGKILLNHVNCHVDMDSRVAILGANGVGKCFAPGTEIRLYDGNLIAVENIVGGEELMGDDGQPRTVTTGTVIAGIATATAPLYKITPTHDGHEPFIVNGAHILVLIINAKPSLCVDNSRGCWKVQYFEQATDGTVMRKIQRFYHKTTADAQLALLTQLWQPIIWEVSVDDWFAAPYDVKRVSMLMQSDRITFSQEGQLTLLTVLRNILGRLPTFDQMRWAAWYIGLWLADGVVGRDWVSQGGPESPDPKSHYEIMARMNEYSTMFGEPCTKVYDQTSTAGNDCFWFKFGVAGQSRANYQPSIAKQILMAYGILNNKHVPHPLLIDDPGVRLSLLAGFIDGDGYFFRDNIVYELPGKNKSVLESLRTIACSLGLRASKLSAHEWTDQNTDQPTYGWRFYLSGDRLWDVAMYIRAAYKQCPQPGTADYVDPNKNSCCYGFTITVHGPGPYHGFAVHGGANRRFLLRDFTVTHNSTILHLMLGRFPPVSGSIARSSACRVSTFTQHHIDTLNLHLSPVEAMAKLFPGHPEQHFRQHLGGFGITGKLATMEISNLSGGQKSRVAFAVVTWRKPHLIIMDEPTNHLDLETIEALISAIKAFEGGVVCVSHDQHFLTGVANEFWGVSNGKVTRFDSFSESRKHTYAAS